MYKFNEYLMVEKVSNKEIKSVLNDTNIQVGIEFEIILDDLGEGDSGYNGYTAQQMDGWYNEYMEAIRKYIKELFDATESYYDYLKDEAKDYIKIKDSKIEKMEKEQEKLEGLLDNFATTNPEEIQTKIDELGFEISEEEYNVSTIKKYVREQNWYEIYEFLVNDDDVESPYEEFEYTDTRISSPPSPDRDVYSFYQDMLGKDIEDINWLDAMEDGPSQAFTNVEYQLDTAPPSAYLEDMEGDESEALQNYDWSDLPFSNYDIGDYHSGSVHSTDWRIEPDSSLDAGGVEIISPTMSLQKMMKILPKMFDWIKEHGGTNSSTGMHVNMSYKGKNFDTDADMLKLMLFVDEGFIWKKFPERIGNTYTPSVLAKVIENIKNNRETISDDFAKLEKKTLSLFKKNIKGPDAKYFGVNTKNATGSQGRIEFRYLGGSNYHRKLKEITSAIGRFGFYMSIALDEKARKKEYILKLNRLHQKFAGAADKNKMFVTSASMRKNIVDKGKYFNKNKTEFYIYKRRKFFVDPREVDGKQFWTIKKKRK